MAGGWAGLAVGGGCLLGFQLAGVAGWARGAACWLRLAGVAAGVSACGEVAGWGVWLLGFRLAQVAAGAGGCGCWGFGLRGWLLGLGGVAGSAGFGSGTGRVFGWRGWLARLARRLAGFGSGICLSSLACLLRLGAWPALVWGVWLGCGRRDLSRCWFRLAA